jgi:polysaccharide biosynthesis transport protein
MESENVTSGGATGWSVEPYTPRDLEPWVEPQGSRNPEFQRYVFAVLRYKWWIVAAVLVGTGLGFLAMGSVEPAYSAHATLWIETSDRNAAQRGPIRSEELLGQGSWTDLLRSHLVLGEVVRQERLFVTGHTRADRALLQTLEIEDNLRPGSYRLVVEEQGWTLHDAQGAVQRGMRGAPIGAGLGFRWAPPAEALQPGRTVQFSLLTPRDAADRLSKNLDARVPRGGSFLQIGLSGADPEQLASTVNAVSVRLVEVAADLKRAQHDELTSALAEQLEYAERALRDAEIGLEGFRVETVTLPAEPATPVNPGLEATRHPAMANFFTFKIDRELLRRDREAIEEVLASPVRGTLVERLERIAAVQQSSELKQALGASIAARAELRGLLQTYTEEHPQVSRHAAGMAELEERVVPSLARSLVADLRNREARLDLLIESASSELRQIPPRAIEEARLRRQVGIAEHLYTNLQRRYEEARLAAVSSIPDIRILDLAATPYLPANQKQETRLLLLAILGSLAAGVGGAIVVDRLDRRIRYPEQVADEVGLPILATIPELKGRRRRLPDAGAAAQIAEAFRTLRLSTTHAHGAGPLLITVTSPGVGDGKSLVSANLAAAFSDLGHRTLLIDGDIRRGVLHRTLGVSRTLGLIDHLAGLAGEEEIIQRTSYEGLDFIGRGAWLASAPELLSSREMRLLLAGLRSRYGVIIVDSPPLGAGAEPYVLGTLTGTLLLVLRAGATNLGFTATKMDLIHRLPIRVLGAVLNAAPATGAYSYYHYLPRYDDQPAERAPAAV